MIWSCNEERKGKSLLLLMAVWTVIVGVNQVFHYYVDSWTYWLIYIYIYIFSVGGGGIWTPDVSVGNTMKCQLCYKALGIVDSLTLTLLWLNKRPNKRLSCNKRLKYYLHPLSLRPLLNLPLNYLNVQSTHSGITTMLTCPFCQNALNLQVFNKITYLPFITKLTVTQKKKKKSIIELIL